jgi:hypothetical protein
MFSSALHCQQRQTMAKTGKQRSWKLSHMFGLDPQQTRRRAFCMVTLACASRPWPSPWVIHGNKQFSSNKSLAKVSIDMANLSYNMSFDFIF